MKKKPTPYNGVVVVDKSAGMTSHDVVDAVRRLFQTKRVGHTGTLDPDATGVLVLCLGQATRLAEYLSAARKHYVTDVVFGLETDTQDASGQTTAEWDASALTEAEVHALLPRFLGKIQQIPPMVSARHFEGRRLYELAREGVTVEREAREIEIYRLEMTGFLPGPRPMAQLEVTCSTGTYIRTLAADLGTAAGVGAIMQTLRRTWVGETESTAYKLADAHTLPALSEREAAGTLAQTVHPILSALRGWAAISLDDAQLARIGNGQAISLSELSDRNYSPFPTVEETSLLAIVNRRGELCAIARLRGDALQPIKVFPPDEPV